MGLLFGKIGYYLVLGWCCMSIFVFMVSWGSRKHEVKYSSPLSRLGSPEDIQTEDVRWRVKTRATLLN